MIPILPRLLKKAGHENADTFNVYAVSADGRIKSNEITVTVAKNTADSNTIDEDSYSVVRERLLTLHILSNSAVQMVHIQLATNVTGIQVMKAYLQLKQRIMITGTLLLPVLM